MNYHAGVAALVLAVTLSLAGLGWDILIAAPPVVGALLGLSAIGLMVSGSILMMRPDGSLPLGRPADLPRTQSPLGGQPTAAAPPARVSIGRMLLGTLSRAFILAAVVWFFKEALNLAWADIFTVGTTVQFLGGLAGTEFAVQTVDLRDRMRLFWSCALVLALVGNILVGINDNKEDRERRTPHVVQLPTIKMRSDKLIVGPDMAFQRTTLSEIQDVDIDIRNERISVDMTVYDAAHHIVAVLRNSELQTLGSTVDANFKDDAIEVIGEDGMPLLQVFTDYSVNPPALHLNYMSRPRKGCVLLCNACTCGELRHDDPYLKAVRETWTPMFAYPSKGRFGELAPREPCIPCPTAPLKVPPTCL